jgi:hypothetical protein
MAYDYEGSVDFRGDGAKALEYARELLSARGFKVLPPAANQLWFTNPVSYLNTKKQPLLMVSKGCITATGSALTLQAELGNLRSLVKFLVMLVGVLAIPEAVIVAVIMVMVAKEPAMAWICLLSAVPIPLILFGVPKLQGFITARALDALLDEAAGVDQPPGRIGRGRSVGFEYMSSARLFGLPLVHIAMGPQADGRKGVAKGIIAVGDVAFGLVFALGGFAVGGISAGGLSVGLLAVGGCALGGVTIGGLAVGLLAFGGLAIGL